VRSRLHLTPGLRSPSGTPLGFTDHAGVKLQSSLRIPYRCDSREDRVLAGSPIGGAAEEKVDPCEGWRGPEVLASAFCENLTRLVIRW